MYYCPCGDRLWTKAELLDEVDTDAWHIAFAYLDDDSAFCFDEDSVVEREWWQNAPPKPRGRISRKVEVLRLRFSFWRMRHFGLRASDL